MEQQHLKSLNEMKPGKRSFVRQLCGGNDFMSRMAALGFTIGVEVQVVQNFSHGPIIVSVRDTHVALGRGEAKKVLVEEVSHNQ
jgi:ferrous iron transport protein A